MVSINTQQELDRYIDNLRYEGYPYLGSDDCTHTLLPNGDIEWQAPAPYPFDTDAEDWRSVQTQDEFEDSVFCWRHDC